MRKIDSKIQIKTLVIGASNNPRRYSNLALQFLKKFKHQVIGISKRKFEFDGAKIYTHKVFLNDVHTVTIYLNSQNQKEYEDYILELNPKRVIFNPGAENKDFQKKLEHHNIECLNACTLVLLQTGQY